MKLDLIPSISFKIQNAYTLSLFSKLVYEGYTQVEKTLKEWECDFKWFDAEGTQALLASKDEHSILAFRGTEPENLGDWTSDLNIVKKRTLFGHIHKGFLKAWEDIAEDVITEVKSQADEGKFIWVCGHSLGGGLAQIATVYLEGVVDYLYTFGSPRVGNKVFVKTLHNTVGDNNIYRVINNCDFVTRVPPRIGGYKHAGELVYIDNDGKLLYGVKALNWWQTFWDRAEGRLESLGHLKLLDGIDDHSIQSYIDRIEKAMAVKA